jgi:hypothetical protein
LAVVKTVFNEEKHDTERNIKENDEGDEFIHLKRLRESMAEIAFYPRGCMGGPITKVKGKCEQS